MTPDQTHAPNDADDQERVSRLLAALGREPAPDQVVARLERVLDATLEQPVRVRRRRPWLRPLLAIGAPVAVVAALVISLTGGGSNHERPLAGQPLATTAPTAAAQAAAGALSDSSKVVSVPSAAHAAQSLGPDGASIESAIGPADPLALRVAALRAYRVVLHAIRARR